MSRKPEGAAGAVIPVATPAPGLPLVQPATPDGPVWVLLRPEDVELAADGIPGSVIASSFLGSLRRTQVLLADDTVISVQHAVRSTPAPGDTVHLAFGGAPVAVGPRDA